jgi:predicted SnoaL-like aldol condensation-catalyzing enzyme
MKRLVSIIGLAILAACKQPAKQEQLVETYFTHFNNHNWQAMANLYTDTTCMKDPAYGQQAVNMSRAEIVQKYKALQEQVPDVKDSVVAVYPFGNGITVEFVSSGTGPDGKPFTLPVCTIFTIVNGKICGDLTYYDNF